MPKNHKVVFASVADLRKELRLLDNQLKEKLADKGYKNIENKPKNEPFEIQIKEMSGKKNCRGTIPMRILKSLEFNRSQLKAGTFVKVKIIGMRKK